MTAAHSIFVGSGASAAYFLLTLVLGGLIGYSFWFGRRALEREDLWPLWFVLGTFFVSRIVMLDEVIPLPIRAGQMTIFALLNMIGFYNLAVFLLRVESPAARQTVSMLPRDSRAVVEQMVYFGLGGGLLYLLQAAVTTMVEFVLELCALAFVAATIRVIALAGFQLITLRPMRRPCGFCVAVGLLVLGWILYDVSPLLSGTGRQRVLFLARALDVASLLVVIASLVSRYVRVGLQYKVEASRHKVEIDEAKTELSKLNSLANNIYEDSSDLLRKQKDQTLLYMKKVEHLEKLFQIGITMQKRQRLEDLLKRVVELVRDNIGFKTVTLRLFNEKAQNFETRAFVGLSPEMKDTVVNYRIPLAEYEKMIEPRFRVSKSYFIRNSSPSHGEEPPSDGTVLVDNTWGDIDMLIVPLINEDNDTVGYLSVENPEDPKLSVADAIDTLENIASISIIAIRNARFLRELEEKNQKLKIYADKLASLNKLKADFVATISHEFRTPLTSIRAYSDTLIKSADEVDRDLLKQFLVVIEEESSRLMALIDDILDFSQMETGAIKFERRPCNLKEIIQLAKGELTRNFVDKNITLHEDVPDVDVVVRAEQDLMKQLIINLLHNAAKFSDEGGKVWVRLVDDTVSARLIVEDEGRGIPDDQLDKIFEQFHQADGSDRRTHPGSGLGLAICKNIAEWHDGRIWVENKIGGGARFVTTIPKKEVVVHSQVLSVASTLRQFELERFVELVVENVAEFLSVRKASLMLVDKARGELRIEGAIGMDEDIVEHARVKIGEGIAGKVAKLGRTMLVKNIEEDKRVTRSNNALLYGSKSFLSVPLKRGKTTLGVLNVSNPTDKRCFTVDDKLLLELFAERVSVAIEQLQEFAIVSTNYERVRDTLKAILESKRYIDLQDRRLGQDLAARVATKLGLSRDGVSLMRYVLNVYDLGLTRIGYHIIKKPKELSPKEREEIERHTIVGAEMIETIEQEPKVSKIVLHHHENFDGSGYPDKLKGDAIPIESRIIRVADSLRALMSQRPYQRQYDLREAMEIVKRRAGTVFDPRVVECFAEAAAEVEKARRKSAPMTEEIVEK